MKSLGRLCSRIESTLILATFASLAACGSAEPASTGNQPQPPATTPTTTPPVMPPPTTEPPGTPPPTEPPPTTSEWKTLLSGDWTMAPGTEGYVCVRKTIDEDLFITVFDAINPRGTHHTFLSMGDPSGPDGIEPCSGSVNQMQQIFGSGVGSFPLAFPKGVAINIKKGSQLVLNLHLFNTGMADISGTSGTRMRTVAGSDAPVIAEHLLGGTIRVDLPPAQTTSTTGYCTMSTDATIFAVTPHMHKLGVYAKIVAERAVGGEAVLYDAPYDFEQQRYYSIDPVAVKKGDRVRVECTHNNTTPDRVTFGESTLQEMCFAGIFRYPADGSPFMCIR
jgi:hypothetical protein